MGIALEEDLKLDEALEAFKKALTINPNFSEAWNNMGNTLNSLYHTGKLKDLEERAKKLLSIFPSSIEINNILGIINLDLDQIDDAIENFKKAVKVKPDFAEGYFNLGNCLRIKGEMHQALDAYKKALSVRPDYAEVYLNKGNIFKKQNQPDQALEAYKEALSINPGFADAITIKVIFIEIWVSQKRQSKRIKKLSI